MKFLKKLGTLLLVIIVVTIIPMLSVKVMSYIMPYVSTFDPGGASLAVSIHHVAQIFFTVLIMLLYRVRKLSEWGFNLKDKSKAFKALGWFALIWIIYEFFIGVLPYIISKQPRSLGFVPSAFNILGVLAFQGLLSGTCEEPLYRGYVMTVLEKSWGSKSLIRIKSFDITSIEIVSAIIFAYAHMNITFIPFSIHFSLMQLIVVFVLGLVNAQAFRRTRSLLGPILLHNSSNVIVILARLIPIWMLG